MKTVFRINDYKFLLMIVFSCSNLQAFEVPGAPFLRDTVSQLFGLLSPEAIDPTPTRSCGGNQTPLTEVVSSSNIAIQRLCGSDPFTSICQNRQRNPAVDQRNARIRQRLDQMGVNAKAIAQECRERFNVTDPASLDIFERQAVSGRIKRCINRRLTDSKEEKRIKKLGGSMAGVIKTMFENSQSPAIRNNATKISKMIQKCMDTAELDHSFLLNADESVSMNIFSWGHNEETKYEVNGSVSGDVRDTRSSRGRFNIKNMMENCQVKLSPRIWQECLEMTPTCLAVMFHEAAHTFNSCAFAEHFLTQDPQARRTSRFTRDMIDVGESFRDTTTACLEQLNNPRDAIISACVERSAADIPVGASGPTDPWLRRCATGHDHAVIGHESEWWESEADLWASTALSYWFDSNVPNVETRRDFIEEAAAFHCDGTTSDQVADEPPVEVLENTPVRRGQRETCMVLPYDTTVTHLPPRWRMHPRSDIRVNKLWLGNSDLRNSLGCTNPGSEETRVASCSPLEASAERP